MDPEIKEFLHPSKRLSDQEIENNFKRYVETDDLQYRDNILKSFYQRIYNYAQRLQLYYNKTYHFEDSFQSLVFTLCESIEFFKKTPQSNQKKVAAYISRALKLETIEIKRKLFVPHGLSGFLCSSVFKHYASVKKIIKESGSITQEELKEILKSGNKTRLDTFYRQFNCLSEQNIIELEKIQNTQEYRHNFNEIQYREVYEIMNRFLTPREKNAIMDIWIDGKTCEQASKERGIPYGTMYYIQTKAIEKLSKLMNKTGL